MTFLIVFITSLISIAAFYSPSMMSKLEFNPYQVWHRKEWYRIITHGFLHADWLHLIINMMVLLSFGYAIESIFKNLQVDGIIGNYKLYYGFLYFGGIIVSSLTTLYKQKDNFLYNAVGASGAVSAVIFTSIFFAPWNKLYLYAFIPIPGIIFGVLYLWYCSYMSKKSVDNINHDAHFLGAIFGFIFPLFMDLKLINYFISQLLHFQF
jgi:membrane associated rhomboid family serine protease